MKYKNIEERFPSYFIFGEGADNSVDVATLLDDTVATTSREHAEKLIQQREEIVECLCGMAQAFSEASPLAFERFWYGS